MAKNVIFNIAAASILVFFCGISILLIKPVMGPHFPVSILAKNMVYWVLPLKIPISSLQWKRKFTC